MDNQQQNKSTQGLKNIWVMATIFLAIVLIIGGVVYFLPGKKPLPKLLSNGNKPSVADDAGVTPTGINSIVKANNQFALNLYSQLNNNPGNIFFSPYSISTALSMTYVGAKGITEKEMAKVLHFPLEQEKLHKSFSELQSYLKAVQDKGGVKLSIANSLWIQQDYHLLNSFLELNQKYYKAGLNLVDFKKSPEQARQKINTWVEDKTQEKIRNLIQPGTLDELTRLVLVNAIYFKGSWASQFDKKRTKEADFWVTSDKSTTVRMMSQKGKFKFKDFGRFKAIELPYAGNDLSMIIFLPEEIDGLPKLEKELTGSNIKIWIDKLLSSYKQEILVSLPKFKTTAEFELSDILSQMGMPSAFLLPPADFSGMTGKKDLYISKVIHKAFIDVNEEGTEAAAATAVVMWNGISRLLTFRADHPFIFLIRENQTGSILFIGRLVNPG